VPRAHFAEEFEDAAGFGWSSSRPPFTWAELVKNKVGGQEAPGRLCYAGSRTGYDAV
jgi:hypothetical protein